SNSASVSPLPLRGRAARREVVKAGPLFGFGEISSSVARTVPDGSETVVAGVAFFMLIWSAWIGRGLFLENWNTTNRAAAQSYSEVRSVTGNSYPDMGYSPHILPWQG